MQIHVITLAAPTTKSQNSWENQSNLINLVREGALLKAHIILAPDYVQTLATLDTPEGHAHLRQILASHAAIRHLPLINPSVTTFNIHDTLYGGFDSIAETPHPPAFQHFDWWNHLTKEDAILANSRQLNWATPHGISLFEIIEIRKWVKLINPATLRLFLSSCENEIYCHLNPGRYERETLNKGAFFYNRNTQGDFPRAVLGGKTIAEMFPLISKKERQEKLENPQLTEECVAYICTPQPNNRKVTQINANQIKFLHELLQITNSYLNKKENYLTPLLLRYLKAENYRSKGKTNFKLPPTISLACGFDPNLPAELDMIISGYLPHTNKTPKDFLDQLCKKITPGNEAVLTAAYWVQLVRSSTTWQCSCKELSTTRFLPQIIATLQNGKARNGFNNSMSTADYDAVHLFNKIHTYPFSRMVAEHPDTPQEIRDHIHSQLALLI